MRDKFLIKIFRILRKCLPTNIAMNMCLEKCKNPKMIPTNDSMKPYLINHCDEKCWRYIFKKGVK